MKYLELLVKSSLDDVKIEHSVILSDDCFFVIKDIELVRKALKRVCKFTIAKNGVYYMTIRIKSGFDQIVKSLGYATVNNTDKAKYLGRYRTWVITVGKEKTTINTNIIGCANTLYNLVVLEYDNIINNKWENTNNEDTNYK